MNKLFVFSETPELGTEALGDTRLPPLLEALPHHPSCLEHKIVHLSLVFYHRIR